MSTPTPGKLPLSQQGKTPSQPQHGAAATPSVSTPFSITQAAFSPHGPRSSPQQLKKASPASVSLGRSTGPTGPVNFDSPSASAALGALDMSSALEANLQTLTNLGRTSDDERARRLDGVIAILSRSKGLVSEAGLERLAKKLELEYMWDNSMGGDDRKTLIIAGSALELLIEFSNNIVQSVSLSFPDSAEIVNKHAQAAGDILFNDLRLSEGQSPLTKSLANFTANFERLAMLDKLSITPGLNLYEAVAGIYESLCRLYAWELQSTREDNPAVAQKGEAHVENHVVCTRSGKPTMNKRGRVGMALDYWKEQRLIPPPTAELAEWAAENEQTWSILIGCAPLRMIGVNPVRISDKWIGPNVVKIPFPDELQTGGPILDWQDPESTFVPTPDQTKADPMQPDASLLGPRLPDAVFHATFDPPVHIPDALWQQIQQLGCMMDETVVANFDRLVLSDVEGDAPGTPDMRTVTFTRKTTSAAPGAKDISAVKSHFNTLRVYKSALARTLTEMTFSHPQQLITILPYLRQYIFLAALLEGSFKQKRDPSRLFYPAHQKPPATSNSTTTTITTNQDGYNTVTSATSNPQTTTTPPQDTTTNTQKQTDEATPLEVDITLTMNAATAAAPQLTVVFPFRADQTATVTLEIREHGHVHVVEQDVLDERNAVAPNGRKRKPEDVGGVLMMFEDMGRWIEFMRANWV